MGLDLYRTVNVVKFQCQLSVLSSLSVFVLLCHVSSGHVPALSTKLLCARDVLTPKYSVVEKILFNSSHSAQVW